MKLQKTFAASATIKLLVGADNRSRICALLEGRVVKRKSLREVYAENREGERLWAAMAGKPLRDDLPPVPEKRVRAAPKPSGIPSEHQEQVAFIKWFRQQYKGVLIFAIPNAGVRSPQLAAYMKAEGLVPGIPDLCIPEWNTWIEFKRVKGGKVSPEQAEIHQRLQAIGHTVLVAHGCEMAIEQIKGLGK